MKRSWQGRAGTGVSSLSVMAKQSAIVGTMTSDLLPTPTMSDHKRGADHNRVNRPNSGADDLVTLVAKLPTGEVAQPGWGDFEPAVKRWEQVVGRSAPPPLGKNGQLSAELVEWMMGYDEGWTALLARKPRIKALGNSIVPQQAAAAWGHLMASILDPQTREG